MIMVEFSHHEGIILLGAQCDQVFTPQHMTYRYQVGPGTTYRMTLIVILNI